MAEQSGADNRITERLTVSEAAARLGISEGAVRGPINRGTLEAERESGTVYVLLYGEHTADIRVSITHSHPPSKQGSNHWSAN